MDRVPEEVVLHILTFLEPSDTVRFQSVSRRYLGVGRDDGHWRIECFHHSRAEALRRRQQLLNVQPTHLAELRNAVTALPGGDLTAWDIAQMSGSSQPTSSQNPAAEARIQRHRAIANWEPFYTSGSSKYYDEFVRRHAPINVGWLDLPKSRSSDEKGLREATGIGTLTDEGSGEVQHVVAPLDDGSVCVWDITSSSAFAKGGSGKLIDQSRSGLLTGLSPEDTHESHGIMTETGAVECVAIDRVKQKAYFAVQSLLHEVDLNTLQVVTSRQYPFPITALSEARTDIPVTVGTNWSIHMNDPRDPAFASTEEEAAGGELIGGSNYSHASLAQPGPLSILHDNGRGTSDDSSIWVAGRFTSLLNYDRRFFPRLRGTIHSGARIASLAFLPFPLVPRSLDLLRNPNASIAALLEARRGPGTTILAAAEYKGKGSLELYGLPRVEPYQNRQTASASKLLSVAPHGGSIVFSDGDGNLKWVERDGFSLVRTFNINEAPSTTAELGGMSGDRDARSHGIWSSTAAEMPGQGDIVQKIVPMHCPTDTVTDTATSWGDRSDINQRSSLLLWTGDGRLGVLGFGHHSAIGQSDERSMADAPVLSAEERAKEDAERQYGMAMRRALERNADEVRFVRGLGMGLTRP